MEEQGCKKKNTLFVLAIVFVLTLSFVLVACNFEKDELPKIELTDGMSLEEVRAALSEVKNYTFTYKEKETIREETYFVNQNGYLIDYIDLEYTYYVANFIADEDSAYYLVRKFNGTEEISHTYDHYTNVSDQFDDAKKEINRFIKEHLNDYFDEVEKNDVTMTVKDGKLIFEGANWICTFYDFNKTTLPIDEYFPGYKDMATENVDEDDNGGDVTPDDGNNDDNNDDVNPDDGNNDEVLFVDGMTIAEVKATLATVESYKWKNIDNGTVYYSCVNAAFYIEYDSDSDLVLYAAHFPEDGKWYALYREVEGTEEGRDYSWSTTNAEYMDFLSSDAAMHVETLLGDIENGNATMTIQDGSITVAYAEDYQILSYAGKSFTIYDFNKTVLPAIEEYFPGYKESATENVDDDNNDDDNDKALFTDGMTLEEVKAVLPKIKNFIFSVGNSVYLVDENGYMYSNYDDENTWCGAKFIEEDKIYSLYYNNKGSVTTEQEYHWQKADDDSIAEIKNTYGANFLAGQLTMVEDGDLTLTVENGKIILKDVVEGDGDDGDTYEFYSFNSSLFRVETMFPDYKELATEREN